MSRSRTTLTDVAARAGVSTATASRVLSGSRDRVSEQLVRRVTSAAAELDYVPNPHARALVRAASATVAVIVHDLADPYFSEIAHGALRVAAEDGRLVMVCATFRDPHREVAYVREMRAQRMHAVLLAGSSSAGLEMGGELARELAAYRREGGRVASMAAGHGHPAAVPDHRSGGHDAAAHLLSLGHRHTAVVAGPSRLASVTARLEGFAAAVEAGGAPPPVVMHADFTRAGGAAATREILEHRPEVTAILALNDLMAIGVVRQLEQEGRTVPEDVSVVGFDDIPQAADFHPALTTVRVPMAEIGAEAMRLALSTEPGERDDRVTVFPTELIVRLSTASPRP
ncbi:MAG: LacI family DNA-binding transcriptional regulator [Acidimicrobiia bacterium]